MNVLKDVVTNFGLHYDEKEKIAWGIYNGFMMSTGRLKIDKQLHIYVSFCVSIQEAPIPAMYLAKVKKPDKVRIIVDKFKISMWIPENGVHDDIVTKVIETVMATIDYFHNIGAVNCDERGMIGLPSLWRVSGRVTFLCEESAENLKNAMTKENVTKAEMKEKYMAAVWGALLGALVGGLVTLLAMRFGIMSCLCGIIMGIAVVWGYRKTAKKFSVASMIICILISAVMTYFVYNLNAAIEVYQAFKEEGMADITLSFCLRNVNATRSYYLNLILIMLAGIGCAGAVSWTEYRSEKERLEMYRLV